MEASKRREHTRYVKPEGAFDNFTSYRNDFTKKSTEKRMSAKPVYQPSIFDRPFNGTTAYQETFKQWEMPVNQSFRHQSTIQLASGRNVDYNTTSKLDFTEYSSTQSGRQSIIPKETPLFGNERFLDETTSRHDFPPKEGGPEKSAKPVHYVLKSTDPFDHKTTFQQNFPWWTDGKKAKICRPKEAPRHVDQPFEGVTTHNMMYKAWDVA